MHDKQRRNVTRSKTKFFELLIAKRRNVSQFLIAQGKTEKKGEEMKRLTKTEKAAAAAVLAMAATVAGTGISLLKKHARLMSQKAAATFKDDDEPDAEAEMTEESGTVDEGEEPKERQYIKL